MSKFFFQLLILIICINLHEQKLQINKSSINTIGMNGNVAEYTKSLAQQDNVDQYKLQLNFYHFCANVEVVTLLAVKSTTNKIERIINKVRQLKASAYSYIDLLSPSCQFISTFKLGEHSQKLIISTYSNMFFVTSNYCKNCGYGNKRIENEYFCTQQKCSQKTQKLASLYDTDIYLEGYISNDSLQIGGVEIQAQFYAIYNNYYMDQQVFEFFNGMIGFGANKKGSIVNQMFEEKKIKMNLFCIQLTPKESETPSITFGEFNNLYDEKLLHYFPLVSQNTWSINIEEVTIYGERIIEPKTRNIAIAVNCDYILMPQEDYDSFLKILKDKINFYKFFEEIEENRSFYCSDYDYYKEFPSFKFTFLDENQQKVSYKITPFDYIELRMFQNYDDQKQFDFCQLKIKAVNGKDWVIGNLLMKYTYTIFNYEKAAVGFIDILKAQVKIQPQQKESNIIWDLYFITLILVLIFTVYIIIKEENIFPNNPQNDNSVQLLPLNSNNNNHQD